MIKIFGDFQNIEVKKSTEYLHLAFSSSSLPLKKRWRNNGLSADFLGDYFTIFFPKYVEQDGSFSKQNEHKSSISYIANELLENAMKFNNENQEIPISIRLTLKEDKLIFWLSNSVDKRQAEIYQNFIQELLNNDPQELYFHRLEEIAKIEVDKPSGLGLITIINDYGTNLGWKFESIENSEDNFLVITMVELDI